jgi:2-polyprenyl-3-methyl-5-hydroxy-6-metoxy-1,4-benzoquinol methylase
MSINQTPQPGANLCRMCGSSNRTKLGNSRGYEWYRCLDCGSLQTDQLLSSQELEEYYQDDYYKGEERQDQGAYLDYIGQRKFIEANLKIRVDWALEQVPHSNAGDWLDVGCAAGFLLSAVGQHGLTPWGIDFSDFGPHFAREELGIDGARQGTIESLPQDFPDNFDFVSFIDVLEHTTDPKTTLIQCSNAVKSGGYLVGETFDPASIFARTTGIKWHAIDPPNHFTVISLQAINSILSSQNMEFVKVVYLSRRLSLGTIAAKFGRPGISLSRKIYKSNLNNFGIPIWFRDVALWIYKKR